MEYIRNYPKIELHCHLDGSVPIETLQKLLHDPELQKEALTVPKDCQSLAEYLTKFDLPLSCMQTKEGLMRAAEDFLLSLQKDNVRYVEVRFAPLLCTKEGLSCREVLEAVLEGLKKGEQKTGIISRVIVCAMRHHSFEENFHVLLNAMEFHRAGVCAMDLAGNEAAYPTGDFHELFRKAKNYRIPFTIHSGECGSVANVQAAYEFGARRVGHGIALMESPELMNYFAKKGIGVEICPTSNFQTKAVKKREEYPLKRFYDGGLKVSINTDNRTVSGTDLTAELDLALGFLAPGEELPLELKLSILQKLQKNAIDTAFVDDGVKQELWRMVENY